MRSCSRLLSCRRFSIGRYKVKFTHLVSASLGRPVRLSSVELRLSRARASLSRILALMRIRRTAPNRCSTRTRSPRPSGCFRCGAGALRSADQRRRSQPEPCPHRRGRWNLESLLARLRRAPTMRPRQCPLPYLEATNSRINFKNGIEKLPFSLVNADVSLWQENPGDWRLRLRGQPARTDVSLDLADTGIVRWRQGCAPRQSSR